MTNEEIAEVFEQISELLEMKGESSFMIRAYQRAGRILERMPDDVETLVIRGDNLTKIPGIGKAISAKIHELTDTGNLQYLENLKNEFPPGILEIMQLPGLGPKTIARMWKELGITTIGGLETAIKNGSLASLPRFGTKSADNILKSIQFAKSKDNRVPIATALRVAKQLITTLRDRCPSIKKLVICGSLRRFEETIGDIDLICVTDEPDNALKTLIELPSVADILTQGVTKVSVILESDIQVDMRVTTPESAGVMVQYFTGNVQHNVMLSQRAIGMGFTLNEHGLKNQKTGDMETFENEESLYSRLGMQFMPPEIRGGALEIDLAVSKDIPRFVEVSGIRGDLHTHTDWSDGRDSMEAMVTVAKMRGLQYIAITDHSAGRGIANGLSIERLKNHMALADDVERKIGGIRVFSGTELDIRADGSLDYPDDILRDLDWVVASVHSAMGQDLPVMTERIIAAMRNPYVSAIGHLSTRLIGQRKPVEADYEQIFKAAKDTGTALEINSSLERLDLKDSHIRRAKEMGVMLVISTDAHTTEGLSNLEFGTRLARRGWCEARHIMNTLDVDKFSALLAKDKSVRTMDSVVHG